MFVSGVSGDIFRPLLDFPKMMVPGIALPPMIGFRVDRLGKISLGSGITTVNMLLPADHNGGDRNE